MGHGAKQDQAEGLLAVCFALAVALGGAASSGAGLIGSNPAASPLGHQVFLPSVLKPACVTHTSSMRLRASSATLGVGDVVTLTATLQNDGCGLLGLPLYRLRWENQGVSRAFEAVTPVEVLHYVGLQAGERDEAEFILRALEPDRAEFRVSVSFEVHLGYPGPAYWSGAAAGPLQVTINP